MTKQICLDNCSPKHEGGQSLVELAITLTVILILLAGIVDLGRAFFAYMALRDSAQEAALFGSIDPTDTIGMSNRALAVLANRVDTSNVTITPVVSGSSCGNGSNSITVTVLYSNFAITMPFLGTLVGTQSFDISTNITDTILSPPCP
ncbi:MAG: pilus assembly protein [Anaerolineales bacterium]|nr:pilus assembly protein [Chloroflexota bacterium]MBL6983090.1 pilus assembly protein [Anaerolineales bacterium]